MKRWNCLLGVLLGLFLSACGGGGGGGSGADPQTNGVYSINSAGGAGGLQGGYGGNGGEILILKGGGTGDLMVTRSGAVAADFTPSSPTASLGSNPLIITADTVISVVTTVPPEGTPYLLANNSSLYISNGEKLTGNPPPVTGLRVAEGATLTLAPNFSTWSRISVTSDIENNGVITTTDISSLQRGHLEFSAARYLGTGIIDTSAHSGGQSGGKLFLYAGGDIVNSGVIVTAGASAASGQAGSGGSVELYARGVLENTGSIDTSGGNAVSGTGGRGGYIDLVGFYGLQNSGSLRAVGGAGTVEGGKGGWIWLEVFTAGDLRSTGDIDSSGGDSNGGNGGHAAEVDIYAYGGSIRHNAEIHSVGGKSQSGHGGEGGPVRFGTYPGGDVATPPGDILVSGNLATTGGSAGPTGNGGNGGLIEFWLGNADDTPAPEQDQRLALLGYRILDSRGGSGNYGGSGGDVVLESDSHYFNPGLLTNESEIVTRGGSVAAGASFRPAHGGKGGNVYFFALADPQNAANPRGTKVNNAGKIDARGGESLESDGRYWWAGSGGGVVLYGADALTNSGSIVARGGDDRGSAGGVSGFGGEGIWIVLFADGPLANSGTLDAGGGYGEYRGGGSGGVDILGLRSVSNSGDIYARGGNARASLFGSRGGDGGRVDIDLLGGTGNVTNTGSVFIQGGTGATPGINGRIGY